MPTTQLSPDVNLVDRYLIQGVIGVGGMGAVYRARDLHFPNVSKLVAIKEMVSRTSDPVVHSSIVHNFEREANLLATLEHRAIPRIYDYFTIKHRSYLVLEYVNGKDLESILADSTDFIAENRILTWAVELCEVLQYLHDHQPEPIIFRDMKPSNVMINAQDHIVLVDFGIARPFQVGQKVTMIGTEGYAPPEQYRGEASPMADIYSLGATLHHLLTRRDPRLEPPFSFGERPIRQANPSVSPDTETVIYKALQYNPSDRFTSAAEMRAALLGVVQKPGIFPHFASPGGHRSADGNIKPVWTFSCEDEIRGAPLVQNGAVYVGSYDSNLYALEAASGKFLWKYLTDGGIVSRPAYHENNLFFGSEDHRLHAISAHSGKVSWTYYAKAPIRSSPQIGEGHIFIGSDDGYLHAINAMTTVCAWQMDAGAPIRSTPLIHDEYVFVGTETGEFFCLDFSGAIKWRFRAKRAITGSPVISQGVVYFCSMDSTLYALDAKSGWVIWRFRLGRASISTPCLAGPLLFTGAADGIIYCIEASSSKEVWRFNTDHQVTGSPLIYRESLYCGSVDGYLYCLDYRTGRLRWKFKTRGPITGTPAACEDIVYIGSTDHTLYALLA